MRRNPLYKAFIDAGQEAGYPYTKDFNGEQQEGFGAMHMTVKNGVRSSTSNAHLRTALKRSNLTLLKKVTAQKVLFNGKQATGIEYLQGGQIKQVHANTEVILSAGSVGSPHLLQLPGIGPSQVLADAQWPLVHDLPGVGENLQDH